MDYKSTLLMNRSNFEMRGNLPNKEPLLVKVWNDGKLYESMNLNRRDAIEFVLHDGPPYANGDMHCGHALNRILKDFVVRYKNMSGYKTPFVPGWDTHGLPIENKVTKSGINRKTTPLPEFRSKCQEYALTQVAHQMEQIKRLGVLGDFDRPYITLNKEYEAQQIHNFSIMALKGLIYKGLKPVYWSPSSESALAEAEIEYKDVTSHSIYVAFKVKDGKGLVDNDARLVIWTTTPWTMPANLAISAHPDFIYGEYATERCGKLVFLKEFETRLKEELDLGEIKLLKEIKGSELEYVVCTHPFYDRDSLVIVGTHVTNETGTGLVHTAPGHGADDYIVCIPYKIKPYCPVDEKGFMDETTGPEFAGKFYEDANEVSIRIMSENGSLLKHETFVHSYPHDWRTNKPLIFRATNQWFCSIEPIRKDLINQIHKTKWTPAWGETRMVNMIKDRADWCISRQRAWGVPIPIIYCEDKTPIIDENVFARIEQLIREHGSNIWYELSAKEILPEGYTNEHSPNGEFTKEVDIMDVWFDSGSSFAGVLKERNIAYPSDLYLEGSDQYRGWFNSSLIISVACYGVAPYKSVVSHGFIMDENWEKMSKSKGNGIDPNKLINQLGADILRLWASTIDYQQDVKLSEGIVMNLTEQYRKIRNTLKFISWNVVDFDPKNLAKEYEDIDIFLLAKLEKLTNDVIEDFNKYDFASAMSDIMTFMSGDLSAFYLDIAKDTLYCDKADSKRRNQMQSVIYTVGDTLLRLLNPILPFTMDEFNKNLPGERLSSPQLLDFPKESHKYKSVVLTNYELFNKVRTEVLKALEEARSSGIIGSAQEAYVEISFVDKEAEKLFKSFKPELLKTFFVVSTCNIVEKLNIPRSSDTSLIKVSVKRHTGHFCERCWNYEDDALEQEDGTYLCNRCADVLGKK